MRDRIPIIYVQNTIGNCRELLRLADETIGNKAYCDMVLRVIRVETTWGELRTEEYVFS